MDIKAVPSYWKKSLEFFKKDNLKLYLLLTLKTWVRSITLLLRTFWWLFAIDLVCVWTFAVTPNLVTLTINAILLYAAIMTARPSLEAKNLAYYIGYLPSIWVVLLFFGLAYFMGNIFAFILLPLPFFFLDSNRSLGSFFKACKQSLKALVCFAPIFLALLIIPVMCALLWTLIIWAIFSSPSELFHVTLFRMIALGLLYVFFDALVILNISGISVLYTKLKHENFNLLFQ